MRETEYGEAATQVLEILNYTNQEDVRKIPESFIKFLSEVANKGYTTNFYYDKPISSLNLEEKTKELLGFIYITWWCGEKDRNNYKNIIYTNNRKMENCEYGDIFKTKKEMRINVISEEKRNETSIIEYKEENTWKSFFRKIVSFFKNEIEGGK